MPQLPLPYLVIQSHLFSHYALYLLDQYQEVLKSKYLCGYRDVFPGVIFLNLFIIQKIFTRFSALLHLKMNELVSSHEPACNLLINLEEKTEKEINRAFKRICEQANQAKKMERKNAKQYSSFPI